MNRRIGSSKQVVPSEKQLWWLPDSAEVELPEPVFVDERVLPIGKDGSAGTVLPSLGLHEGFVLTLARASGKR